MLLPLRPPVPSSLPKEIKEGLGPDQQPLEVLKSRDYVLVYGTEDEVRGLRPDRSVIDRINLDPGGIVATARAGEGEEYDFVSRWEHLFLNCSANNRLIGVNYFMNSLEKCRYQGY